MHTARTWRRTVGWMVATAHVAMGLVPVLAGCAAPAGRASAAGSEAGGTPPAPALPPNALLTLGDIKPVPTRPVAPPDLSPPSARGGAALSKARALAARRRYTEAAIELERGLRTDPDHPELLAALADVYSDSGSTERARESAAKAVAINPDIARAHVILGRIAATEGRHADAITQLRIALRCSDLDADPHTAALTHLSLARSLAAERYLTAALDEYNAYETLAATIDHADDDEPATAPGVSGGSEARAKADLLDQLGRYAEAADELRRVLDGGTGDDDVRLRRARLLLKAGRADDALAALRVVESDDDAFFDVLAQVCRHAGHAGCLTTELRARIAERGETPARVLHLADALSAADHGDEARAVLERFIQARPDALDVRMRLVTLLADRGAWLDVLAVAGAGAEQEPSQAPELARRVEAILSQAGALDALVRRPVGDSPAGEAYVLGRAAGMHQRWDMARRWLEHGLSKRPGWIPARAALASMFLTTFQWEDAIRVAARAEPATVEDARLEIALARAYEGLDDDASAEQHYKAAIQMKRADSEAMFALAQLYRRTGRGLQYERQLLAILREDPLFEPAREAAVMRYIAAGNLAQAQDTLDELSRLSGTSAAVARCAAAMGLARTGDVAAFRQVLTSAMEQGGEDVATLILLADSYLRTREFAAAREVLQRAARLDPDDEDVAMRLVRVDYSTLDYESAVQTMQSLLPRYPNRDRWRLAYLELLTIVQDFDAALAAASEPLDRKDLDPTVRAKYREVVLDVLQLQRRTDERIQRLTIWAGEESPPGMWTARLIEATVDAGQARRALPIAESLLRANPDSPAARDRWISTLLAAGQTVRAVQEVMDWLVDDPENVTTLRRLARTLGEADRIDAALELVRNERSDPLLRDPFLSEMVWLLDRSGAYEPCARLLEDLAQEGGPDRAGMFQLLAAEQWMQAGRHAEAQQRLTRLIGGARDDARRSELLQALAASYQDQGMVEQAAQAYERALELDPLDSLLNNNLGYMLADRGERLDEAERRIRVAVSQSPRQASYLDSLGWVLYKKGDFAGARKWLVRAVQADPEPDAVVLDHLGDAAWRVGAKDAATERWTASAAEARKQLSEDPDQAEMRRVHDAALEKIKRARSGAEPAVAPVPTPPPAPGDASGNAPGSQDAPLAHARGPRARVRAESGRA